MRLVLDVLSVAFIAVGAAMALIAGVGMHRMTGTTLRMHIATKPATLGVFACAIGAALRMEDVSSVTKILVVIAFQFITVPIGAHMLARAITRSGTVEGNE